MLFFNHNYFNMKTFLTLILICLSTFMFGQVVYDFETGEQGWVAGMDATTSCNVSTSGPGWSLDTETGGTTPFTLGTTWFGTPNQGSMGAERSWIVSPALEATADMVTITFDSYSSNESGYPMFYDVEHVQVSVNGGAFFDLHANDPQLHGFGMQNFQNITYSVSVSAGDEVVFRFLYDTCDGCCGPTNITGWYVDNISIEGVDDGSGPGGGSGECNETDCVMVTCPEDITVACIEDFTPDPASAIASFSCGSEASRYVTQPHVTGAANCDGTTYVYSYKVIDSEGNKGCCDQIVTIANADPMVTVSAGGTVECYGDIENGPGAAEVTVSCDNDYELKILPPVIDGVHECPGTMYIYTYRVRDNCGREATADRVFTIGNNAMPTIVAPPDMTVSCDFNANLNPDYAEVTTGCTLGYTTTVSGPNTSGSANCPGSTYTYTYTVMDDCGRTASDTRTFTIANDAPVFVNCPEVPLQLNCEDYGWEYVIQAWLASVGAESSCGDVLSVSNNYNPNTQGLCINNGTKTVRWFATDNCGRTSMCEGKVIIADTEPPVFTTAPQDELVVCNYITQDKLDAWVDANGYAEVEDCWDNVSWSTFPNNPTINCEGNPGPTSLTVTFVATDGCGNKSSMDATFTALPAIPTVGGSNEGAEGVEQLQLFQNQPNPFGDETSISFYLPEGGKATLSIYDVSGKLLHEIRGDYKQGMNIEEISSSDLQPGMLYYQLSTATETATKRMIVLD